MNLTIVSVPFPFNDSELTITHQHNAIKSWTLLDPKPEIILLGYETGVAEVASQYGALHVPGIGVNELGDLSMRSIFRQIAKHASNDWIAYMDTDALLLDDFMPMFEFCSERWNNGMMCAGRWDARIPYKINFENPHWQRNAKNKIFKLHRKGCDYFVYRKGQFQHIPDFSIGKGAWDGWMIGAALQRKMPTIDVTDVCKVIHQWHGMRWSGHPGTGRNRRLTAGIDAWIDDATIRLKEMKE